MDTRELREKYRRFARWYDLAEAIPEVLWIRRLRRKLLPQARGRVLEVAAGTGRNFPFYPGSPVIAVDLSLEMLRWARRRIGQGGRRYLLAVMDAERLAPHAQMLGCYWNREPLDLARQAGLRVTRAERRFLGVFHAIEARAGPNAP